MNVVRTQASHLILYSQQPMVASDSFYKTELNPPTLGKDGWGGGGGGQKKTPPPPPPPPPPKTHMGSKHRNRKLFGLRRIRSPKNLKM